MKDLTAPRWIKAKGIVFLLVGFGSAFLTGISAKKTTGKNLLKPVDTGGQFA